MAEIRYMISDAAHQVGVESHVLRNWEEELDIPVGRTELGHRYYTKDTIFLLKKVKELRDKGFQLKAIKVLMPELQKLADRQNSEKTEDEHKDIPAQMPPALPIQIDLDKLDKFQAIMDSVVKQALQDNNAELEERISDTVTKEMDLLLQIWDERQEERYRKLDENIRLHQKSRKLVAATKERHFPFGK